MLKIKNITKKFGQTVAIDDVSFDVVKGDIVALLGENGAGKSTLLRIIAGYMEASSGTVEVYRDEIKKDRIEILQKSGYAPEISALYGEMGVFDFLCFVANIRQINPVDITEQIKKYVKMMALDGVLNKRIDTLSKGFKKRVELAAIMLSEPEILLLDEPTEGLDPNQKSAICNGIKKYAKGKMVVVSTHAMDDVEVMANRVVLLHKGKIKVDARLQDFKNIAQDNLLKSFQKITLK